MRNRSSQIKRISAATLVGVWLTVPFLSLLHGSHAHRYCDEHQTIEEASPSTSVTSSAPSPEVEAGIAVRSADSTGGVDGAHQECPVFAAQHRDAVLPTPTAAECSDELEASLSALVTQTSGAQLPLLALAPKASPPRL
jgi:hypothetical protein